MNRLSEALILKLWLKTPTQSPEILHQILTNQIQQPIKRIIYHDQVGFIPGTQGFFNICKSISVIHHINKTYDHLNRRRKSLWQNSASIYDFKKIQEVGIEGACANIIKAIYYKRTADIILNGEKLKAFPLKSGTRQGCLLLPLVFTIVLEILATTVGAEKEKSKPK